MDINGTLISSTTDEHGPIYVYETRIARILSFDGKIYQSSMKLKKINGLALGYTQAMMSGLLFLPKLETATVLGLGAGSMVKSLLNGFPTVQVIAVEYREAVVNAAKQYFYLPESARLNIHIDDAANYIKTTKTKSDIIFSDLYNSEGMEPKQVQSSYLRDCKSALNEQGVLVLNLWHTANHLRQELNELLKKEFKSQLLSFEVDSGNTIVLAFKTDIPVMSERALMEKMKHLEVNMNISMEIHAEKIWKRLHK
jgi:spermidine synthase